MRHYDPTSVSPSRARVVAPGSVELTEHRNSLSQALVNGADIVKGGTFRKRRF